MPEKPVVLHLDKPDFEVKLHSDALEVNLKEGARKEIEKLAEARHSLSSTIGWVFQTIIPLNVPLWQIDKVEAEPGGRVNLVIPHRRDLHIPLDPAEAQNLKDKLSQLIPVEKAKELDRQKAYESAQKDRDRERNAAFRIPRTP